MSRNSQNPTVEFDSTIALFGGDKLRFELQPIYNVKTRTVDRYELLYRGAPRADWHSLDLEVVRHLLRSAMPFPPLLVNLSNDCLLNIPFDYLVALARKQDRNVIFELSESFMDRPTATAVYARINQFIASGVHFAIDDFGAGHDGLLRLSSITGLSAIIKLDGDLVLASMTHPVVSKTMSSMIQTWRKFGVAVVAEKVEDADIFAYCVEQLDVDLVQGWYVDEFVNETQIHLVAAA